MPKTLACEHGIVCRLADDRFGYFGWPSVALTDSGALVAVASGMRTRHVCPWGRTVLCFSHDRGRTWTEPRVINDSPLDDRDAGIVNLGRGRLLATWFTSDTRAKLSPQVRSLLLSNQGFALDDIEMRSWAPTLSTWTETTLRRWQGSWILLSEDDGSTWSVPIRVPCSTPHGPLRLAGGDLLYLGKDSREMQYGPVIAARSRDGGRQWEVLGAVPVCEQAPTARYMEPHVVELTSGALLGMIRVQRIKEEQPDAGLINDSLFHTQSLDGGHTWSEATPTGVYGSPPHLLRHSSGTLVCVYGYRRTGYGQRAMLSDTEGAAWDSDWIIRDDGPDWDLGYPASVEMEDGSLFTVYYQKMPGDAKCSLLWSRWKLPS